MFWPRTTSNLRRVPPAGDDAIGAVNSRAGESVWALKVVVAMDTVNSRTETLLDQFLQDWDFREYHSRRIEAPAHRVRAALLAITPRDLPFSSLMLALRLAPAALMARRRPPALGRPLLDHFHELGFVELANTESEIVLGAVGQFWRFREELVPLSSAENFTSFDTPGFAKGAMNIQIVDEGDTTVLSTETRVHATDDRARRSFRPFWIPVRAIGGVMRLEMLRAVARRATNPSDRFET